MWKIKNISNAPVKIAAAKSNTITIGIIMAPGEFCICESRMTASIDAQSRRKLIAIDKSYANDLKLALCECYSDNSLEKAAKAADDFAK